MNLKEPGRFKQWMQSPKVILQHYVPRLYLRHFTFDKNQSQVRCFDKGTRKTFATNITRIAAGTYFYDTKFDQNQIIERSLGDIESHFNDSYLRILKAEDPAVLSDRDREVFSTFIAVQEFRTQEFRNRHVDFVKQMTKAVLGRMHQDATEEAKKKFVDSQNELLSEEGTKKIQILSILQNTPETAEILLNMKWVLLKNPTDLPFWASDHPVTRFNPLKSQFYGNMGLACSGIQLYFPLSSSLCLLLRDPVNYKDTGNILVMQSTENVKFVNQFQVRMSTRFLIARKTDFSLAEEMIKDHPELSDPNRKRWEVG